MSKNIVNFLRTKTLTYLVGAVLMFSPLFVSGQAQLPFTMTEAALKDASICTVTGTKIYSWDGGVVLSNEKIGSGGGGWNWDDKTLRITVAGHPDSIYYSASHSSSATGNAFIGSTVDGRLAWLLKESSDGVIWDVLVDTEEEAPNFAVKLSPTTKYIDIVYRGNLAGYIKNLRITPIYKLKVVSDGKVLREEFVRAGTPITIDEQPTKDCYKFVGWDKENITTMPANDLTVTAKFEAITYESYFKVTNEELGVTESDFSQQFVCGTDVSVMSPSQTGYKFGGWEPEPPTKADASMDGATYTAKWTHTLYTLTIVFEDDSIVKQLHYGDSTKVEIPELDGYRFDRWVSVPPETMPASDLRIEAILDEVEYNLILNKGLDFIPQQEIVNLDYKETISVNPLEHEGYTFLGWDPELPATMPASDFETYAQWKANQYRHVVYTSETDSTELLIDYGTALEPLPTLEKTGYNHLGWDVEQPETMPAHDLIFHPKWEMVQYHLNLMVDGAVYKSYQFHYNDLVVLEDYQDPQKEGYTFTGWNALFPETMPAENLEFEAQWQVNQYRYVVYTSETDSTEEWVNYGESLEPLSDLEKEGYLFKGWDVEQPATMPAHDLVIKAVWGFNQYKIDLMVDGELYQSLAFDFGAEVSVEVEEPKKEGYAFAGWGGEFPKIMPAENLIYNAKWNINQYRYVVYYTESDSMVRMFNYGYSLETLGTQERTGYTFKGWDVEQPATMPAYNLTIRALWEINQYNLNLLVDGEVYKTFTFDYNAPVELEYETPKKEGHTFVKWNGEIPEVMPAKDVELEAEWSVNEYKLIVVNNPTDLTMNDTFYYEYGKKIEEIVVPERVGHTFVGWDKEIPETMPAQNLILQSQWKVNVYTLNFYSEGALYLKQTYEYGATIEYESVSNPIRTGYFFLGWDLDKPTTMPAKDVNLTARWSLNAHELILVTDANNPSTNDTLYYDFGASIEPIADPEKEGYTFLGWDVKIPSTMPDNSLVVTAKWSINNYTLTTLVNCVPTTYIYTFGDEVSIADPNVEGYEFKGWNPVIPSTMPGQDVLVIADMQILQYNFITKVDDDSDTILYNFNEAIVAPEAPTKEGHTFKGWSSAIPATMPAEDVIISALWETNSYKVYFVSDEDTLQTLSYKYGAKIERPKSPSKEGYLFLDWLDEMGGEIPATMPAKDLVFNAEWMVNSYYFVTIADGDTVAKKYDYMEEIATPEIPTRKGYTFAEWNKSIPATMPAYNDTVKALWDVNSYVLTWVVDGDSSSVIYTYGEPINKVKDPEKVGYTFVGWDQFIAETMPDRDLVYNAEFVINSYQFIVNVDGKRDSTSYNFGDTLLVLDEPVKKGHTFVRWLGNIPATMPAYNVEVYALFERDTFELKIKAGEETIVYNYPYDSEIQTIIAPAIKGKQFDKWSEELPVRMPDENLEIEALYKANQYQLTILFGNETSVEYYNFEEEIGEPATPKREGYTFVGWDVEFPAVMPDSNVVIAAKWEINQYDFVVVVDNDSTTTAYNFGAPIEKPVEPTKEGYIFKGWDREIPATMPAENIEVKAKFVVDTFLLTTIVENVRTEVRYPYGANVDAPEEPTREGYTFAGWSTQIPATMPAADVVTEALWKVDSYDLIIVVDEDSTTVSYEFGAIVEQPATPQKSGYIFEGWSTEIPYMMPAEDVRIEAKFSVDAFIFTTIVDAERTEVRYNYGEKVKAPKEPTREGYTFAGWSEEIPSTMPDSNVTVSAQWTINQYEVAFVVDGDTVQVDNYDFGADVEEISVGDKEGYTFSGWDARVPLAMPAKDLVFNAVWVVDSFNFIYEVEGLVTSINYAYGDSIEVPKDPTRKGYEFVGWDNEIPAIMPNKDLVVTALWKAKKYVISFTIDGVTYKDSVTYGDNLVLETPVKAGYVFAGWDTEVPEDMPDHNIKITAKFEPTRVLTTWTEYQRLFVAGLADDVEVELYDLSGKLIYVGTEREFELPTGPYVVRTGEQYKKVVVQ
ncbi:MAG: InlB B-repeat-containing protein [Paludibacteraceae bacterium]|nr:InlB B-repeat-containing protein [Paludibacteraceae bacterium]